MEGFHFSYKEPQAGARQEKEASSACCQTVEYLEKSWQSGEKCQGQKGCGYIKFIEIRFAFHYEYLPFAIAFF